MSVKFSKAHNQWLNNPRVRYELREAMMRVNKVVASMYDDIRNGRKPGTTFEAAVKEFMKEADL